MFSSYEESLSGLDRGGMVAVRSGGCLHRSDDFTQKYNYLPDIIR